MKGSCKTVLSCVGLFLFVSLGWASEQAPIKNQIQKGLSLMKQSQTDPSALISMDYGSLLLGSGVIARKNGQYFEAMKIFREAENQLSQAIAEFDPEKNAENIAHAYFLLGEIYLNAFSDPDKANDFYYKSLQYYENPSARTAIAALKQSHK